MMASRKKKAEEHVEVASPKKRQKSRSLGNETAVVTPPPAKVQKGRNSLKHSKKKAVVKPAAAEADSEDEVDEDDNDFEDLNGDSDIDIKQEIDGSSKKKTRDVAEIDWSEQDLMELITRMEHVIPPKDNLKLESRVIKLNWDEVSFGDHSPEQCKEVWLNIQTRLRRFRILKEVLEDAKDWVSKPWTNFYRSSVKNRHPELPKRPLSTYMLYYLKKKDKVAKEHPHLEMTGVSKFIAEEYKELTEKKKAKYTQMAAAERKTYEAKMEEFYRNHPDQVPKPNATREMKFGERKGAGPQKPLTPFRLYYNDKLRKHAKDKDLDKAALLATCRETWKTLSDKKKYEYINRVMEEENKYLEDLKLYKTDNPEFVASTSKPVLTKDERSILEKVAGKPEKPPNSGYSLFSRLMLVNSDMKKTPPKERMAKISQLWKNMTEEDQTKYKEQVIHMLDQYKLEYATYLESLSEEKKAEELSKNQPKRKPSAKPSSNAKPKASKKKAAGVKVKSEQGAKAVSSKPGILYKNEPVQPPVNVCSLFMEAYMKKESNIPLKQRETKAMKAWREVPEKEKAVLRKELSERKQQYIKQFEKFLKSLSQEELKEYSLWKASGKAPELSEDSASESESSTNSESASGSSDSSDSGNEDASSFGDDN